MSPVEAVVVRVLAEHREDRAGEWHDDGRPFPSAREARDGCIADLASRGYSGATIRVLRVRTDRTCEVVADA